MTPNGRYLNYNGKQYWALKDYSIRQHSHRCFHISFSWIYDDYINIYCKCMYFDMILYTFILIYCTVRWFYVLYCFSSDITTSIFVENGRKIKENDLIFIFPYILIDKRCIIENDLQVYFRSCHLESSCWLMMTWGISIIF